MNDSTSSANSCVFDSRDSVIFTIDAENEPAAAPDPTILNFLKAERERVARWEAWLKENAGRDADAPPAE